MRAKGTPRRDGLARRRDGPDGRRKLNELSADPKRHATERYSRFAAGYVASASHARGAELQRLVGLAAPKPTWVALDVATGGGHTALAFAPYVQRVVASDLTPAMLEKARTHAAKLGAANLSFAVADAEGLPFRSGSFDIVTCRIAPHHFPDPAAFVREAARVLAAGGVFVLQDIVVPDGPAAAEIDAFERTRDPSHVRSLSEREWRILCAAAGLPVEHTEEIVKRHDFEDWTGRQGNSDAVKAELDGRMTSASAVAAGWMAPEAWGTPEASFVNHHVLVIARR